jgi:hypothetical protein
MRLGCVESTGIVAPPTIGRMRGNDLAAVRPADQADEVVGDPPVSPRRSRPPVFLKIAPLRTSAGAPGCPRQETGCRADRSLNVVPTVAGWRPFGRLNRTVPVHDAYVDCFE